MVNCPICGKNVKQSQINEHIDSNCTTAIEPEVAGTTASSSTPTTTQSFFKTPVAKRDGFFSSTQPARSSTASFETPDLAATKKRPFEDVEPDTNLAREREHEHQTQQPESATNGTVFKKHRTSALERAAPLAEQMRPKSLDEIYGQEIVSTTGVLRALIETDRVPSMILWGDPGTGKTTIARLIAQTVNCRFIEINSTSTGVAECKKLFAEAKAELSLTGRRTIVFCDEIHRFSKSQQDVFLGPVEAGHITLIGATTENPSFKVQSALLSRCRVFILTRLSTDDITTILKRCLTAVQDDLQPGPLIDDNLLTYLAQFSDGDARTALNLLDLAISLSRRPTITLADLKQSLTQTLIYDRAGDQHYDNISAFHKSIRGNHPDAALYYLARMLASGEDPLYIARRLIVIASEDIGLADNGLLALATSTYAACQYLGLPECRIPLAHCTTALALSRKSVRAYRGLKAAESAIRHEPGLANLPVPVHLRNAPTRLMKELGHGADYKYPPDFKNGRVQQEYLPAQLVGRKFLLDVDFGDETDPDLELDPKVEENTEDRRNTSDSRSEKKGDTFKEGEVTSRHSEPNILTTEKTTTNKDEINTRKLRRDNRRNEFLVEGVALEHDPLDPSDTDSDSSEQNQKDSPSTRKKRSQTSAPEDWQ